VGVGGTDYFPFIWLAQSFGIPWYVFSDGEDKPVKQLAADAKRAGVDDISKAENIVVLLDKLDLEAYLMANGYFDAFEAAIEAVTEKNKIDAYIKDLNGKPGKTINGVASIRDYNGDAGRKRAAHDIVSERKTLYAAPLASAILALKDPSRRVPGRVADLFKVMGKRFGLQQQKPELIGKEEDEGL
jgi:putative ATP-dependent endonuclease of OLD family